MAGRADRGNLDQPEREKPLSSDKTKNTNRLPTHGPARLAALAGALTLLLAACAVPIPQDAFGRVNPLSTSEREALVALYDATGGAEWKRNAKWLSDEHIASWSGVRYYHQIREAGSAQGVSRRTVEFVRRVAPPGQRPHRRNPPQAARPQRPEGPGPPGEPADRGNTLPTGPNGPSVTPVPQRQPTDRGNTLPSWGTWMGCMSCTWRTTG